MSFNSARYCNPLCRCMFYLSMARKYAIPSFLDGVQTQFSYERWLHRKAMAHVKRDRRRGNDSASVAEYKLAIHSAVAESRGHDAYTGELLDWTLLSKYDNEQSKKHKREYKKRFALLPSVDHVGDGTGPADFKICGWRTNDCKNDLTLEELRTFCHAILKYAEQSRLET